jgi:hypothetical protein
VLEFYSGAAGLPGRFTEGFLLRRSQPGASRNSVISELGVPEQSVEKDGKRVDTYKLDPNAPSQGTKVAVTSFHFVADALTLGMWEAVGTPFELANQPELTTYLVTYSAEDKVQDVKTYEESSPPERQKPG